MTIIVVLIAILSFISGLTLGYQIGFRSTGFKGTLRGKHNIKLVNHDNTKKN